MKRVLIIIGILLIAAGIVLAGIFLRGGGKTGDATPGGNLPTGGTLPISDSSQNGGGTNPDGTPINNGAGGVATTTSGEAILTLISRASVWDYAVSPQMGMLFLDLNGSVTSVSSTETVIANANFGNITGGWFSPDGKWLLVRSGAIATSRWSLLDVAKKTWKDINANTSEMVWSPTGNQLAYFTRRTSGSTLSTYNPTTGATKALLTLSASDLTLRWQNLTHIFVMDRPSSLVPANVWDFSIGTGTFLPFATNVAGADIIWGGAQTGGLLFKAGPTGGTLSLVNAKGVVSQVANFLTLPSKCAFGDTPMASTSTPELADYLFCAIPPNGEGLKHRQLPDDYLKKVFGTSDIIYAIDLDVGIILPVTPASQTFSFDAGSVKVYGKSLYFINQHDRKLYRVSLDTIIQLNSEL